MFDEEDLRLDCPNCGATVAILSDECPNCGFDIRGYVKDEKLIDLMEDIDDETYEVKGDTSSIIKKIKKLGQDDIEMEELVEEVEVGETEVEGEEMLEEEDLEDEEEVEEIIYECPLCGEEVGEDDDQCPNCGAVFEV